MLGFNFGDHILVMGYGFAVLYLNVHRKIQMKHFYEECQHYFRGDPESHHAG